MNSPSFGVSLPATEAAFDRLGDVEGLVDHFELRLDQFWEPARGGGVRPRRIHARLRELRESTHKMFVARGQGWAVASDAEAQAETRAGFCESVARDWPLFGFGWYSEPLALPRPAGAPFGVPLPLPLNARAASVIKRNLAGLRDVVPAVAIENAPTVFSLGDPHDEPAFICDLLRDSDAQLVLDLSAVWISAVNQKFDPQAWVDGLPLDRVIEIRLSGASWTRPEWLPWARSFLIPDAAARVADPVWLLLEDVARRCPALRALTLERFASAADGARVVVDDLARTRELLS